MFYEGSEGDDTIRLLNETTVETVVQLFIGDIDQKSLKRKSAAKNSDKGMISGYSKENKTPETTNVKMGFSLEHLDLSELRGC